MVDVSVCDVLMPCHSCMGAVPLRVYGGGRLPWGIRCKGSGVHEVLWDWPFTHPDDKTGPEIVHALEVPR